MAKILRTLTDADFTTKGAELTWAELDNNQIEIWNQAKAPGTVLDGTTNDDTPEEILDNSEAVPQQVLIDEDTTVAFKIFITGTQTDYVGSAIGTIGDTLTAEVTGAIRNVGGTTELVNATVTEVARINDPDADTWDYVVDADDSTDALTVTVTGEVGKIIKWSARVIKQNIINI